MLRLFGLTAFLLTPALLSGVPGCGAGFALAQAVPQEQRQKIEQAIPQKAIVQPLRARRLLIFDRNVNYGGHGSIPTANLAFTLMGQKTGAFETEVHTDPSVFQATSLARFDAVFFNNNVGNLFEDPALRENLAEFVFAGGGLLGVHGTSVAFTRWPGGVEDWPEFGLMIGARGANHKASNERVYVRVEDPQQPLTRMFAPAGFEYRDEFFRVHDPYSRARLRILLSIDTQRTDLDQTPAYGNLLRADNDYALAWISNHGRGRTFYCTIAHNPAVFWDPKMLEFYLAAIQFTLGDLPAPATPSKYLTSAVRAQEKLGWRLAAQCDDPQPESLLDAIARAAQLGVPYVSASSAQQAGSDIPQKLDERLGSDVLRQLRLKLGASGVRLISYRVDRLPAESDKCSALFAFARRIGAETIICGGEPGNLDALGTLCDRYEVKLAFAQGGGTVPQDARDRLQQLVRLFQGRSSRLGLWGDMEAWRRAGVDLAQAARLLGDRLLVVQWRASPDEAQRPELARFVGELHRSRLSPLLFTTAYSTSSPDSNAEFTRQASVFNQLSEQEGERP